MPDLLGHFGAQSVASHSILRKAEAKWILLGAMLPDLPWIAQRIVQLVPFLDPFDLRIYFVVQASIAFSLVLAAALAVLSRSPGRVLAILGVNLFLHLLLDTCQTKWAYGGHLVVPMLQRTPVTLSLFWPESHWNLLIQSMGLGYLLWKLRHPDPPAPPGGMPSARRLALSAALAAVYFLLPLGLLGASSLGENSFVETIREVSSRPGRYVEFDRCSLKKIDGGEVITILGNENIRLQGHPLGHEGIVSIRGVFLTSDTLRVDEMHEHTPYVRDLSSCLALLVMAAIWLQSHPSLTARIPFRRAVNR
jgi:hypothetical protein